MSTFSVAGLSWHTPDGDPLFTNLTLSFGRQRTGLVGRNGTGKTTLMRLLAGALTPRLARVAIAKLRAAPPRYSKGAILCAFALASATAAPMFGGGVGEVLLAGLLAMTLAPLAAWMGRSQGSAGLFEPVASFLVALIAHTLARITGLIAPELVVVSALIVLVPGLRLTVALTELASGHLVSGTARLAGAATVFLLMLLGVAMGAEFVTQIFGSETAYAPVSLGLPIVLLGVALAPLSFVVLFSARIDELGPPKLPAVGESGQKSIDDFLTPSGN